MSGGNAQPVQVRPRRPYVDEPDVPDTIAILRGLEERYEVHHGVRIQDTALVAAATLSNRYIADRFLPDKAIDLMDEAASRLRILRDVLDTNAVSALVKGDALVLDRLERQRQGDVGALQPVLAEIAYGLERLSRSRRREALRVRFELIRGELGRVPWTDEVRTAFGSTRPFSHRRARALPRRLQRRQYQSSTSRLRTREKSP